MSNIRLAKRAAFRCVVDQSDEYDLKYCMGSRKTHLIAP